MTTFRNPVTTEAELRALMGTPSAGAVKKEIHALDVNCRAFIARSPFVLVATAGADGRCDVSPKGDGPGFVLVVDEHHLLIPDRPGNKRFDGMRNILENPHVGLIFLLPGVEETLRVNGRATIVRDLALRESMAVDGKAPQLVLVVDVEQAFIHCGKCMLRSRLWQPDGWPELDGLPSQAQCLVDHGQLKEPVEEVQAWIEKSRVTRLY